MPDIDLSYAVGLAPRDAIHYFESKGHKITFNWHDMWQEAHARSFTVAGVAKADLLADIKAVTARAIAEGQTARWHLNELAPVLQKKGWWGEKEVTDPHTGEVRRIKQGSPERLNLIYRQNVQGAYNAGRWKQQQENAEAEPYLEYIAIEDSKTRPGHKLLNRKVFRADDAFWATHYPPNGWKCRCRVRSRSERSLARSGLAVESSEGRIVTREVDIPNPRTGEVQRRTVTGYKVDDAGRVAWTDIGFDYNAGATFQRDLLAHMPTPPQRAATNWKELGLPSLRDVPDAERLPLPSLLPQVASREEAAEQLAKALGFTGHERLLIVETPMGKRTLWRDLVPHMVAKAQDARERFANFVLPTLTQPQEIWLTEHKDGHLRENYVASFRGEGHGLLVVVRINRDGSLLWNMMQRDIKGVDKWREGWLAWQKRADARLRQSQINGFAPAPNAE